MPCSQSSNNRSAGFTLIEMLIIAPIVIIFIGIIIVMITSITGESLQARERNTMAYQVQDALDIVETETSRSATYPATTGTLTSPQGSDNSTAAFTVANNDISSTDNDTLIITSPATTTNPINSDKDLIYYNTPNACASADVSKNAYYPITTVYFVSSGSLWQRTILPSTGTPCSTPWQRSSCSTSQSLTGICKTYDNKLVDNVSSFSVQYLKGDGSTLTAAETNKAKAINLTLTASKTVAGKTITYTGSTRSTALNGGRDPITVSFAYTGAQQTWTVPTGITSVDLEAWGAQGGSGTSYTGGQGGYAAGTLAVTPGETLYVNVGGAGSTSGSIPPGGWNGGGSGYIYTTSVGGGGGGGASDIRKGGSALANRVLVAGGGGGSSSSYNGGAGGGTTGGNAGTTMGGTQSAGGTGACSQNGALGQGGSSASGGSAIGYGGGGGGYYGGGAGCYSSSVGQPGAGGSGYTGGVTGASMTNGSKTGDGQIKITY